MSETNNNKIDIRKLLNENNIPTPNRQKETDVEKIVSNVPAGFDKSLVENSSEGIEIENAEILKNAPIKGEGVTGNIISEEQMASIMDTIKEIDEESQRAKKEFDEWNLKQAAEAKLKEKGSIEEDDDDDEIVIVDEISTKEDEDLVDKTTDREEFVKKYKEAVVIIDKSQMGHVINFTDAERAKLEKVKKIKLEEVETIELPINKCKRVKKGSADKILKKTNSIRTTPVVLPVSGFTAVMKGCSTFELMGLVSNNDNSVEGLVSKWTLIHSKIESTSIGHMDFNKFLNSVSQMEYELFVYGILCATFPDEDVFPLTCPKCQTDIEHKYSVRTLLRAELMSDRLKETVAHVVDSSYTEEKAKECFENSLLNTNEVIVLPESQYIFKIGVQTAYSFIYDSVDAIDKMDVKYANAAILSSTVDSIFIKDPDDDSYFEIDDTEDKIKIIYSLASKDISILGAKISKVVEGMQFEFGLMDVNCGNKKCNNHVNTVPVEMDSILFHKYQQTMNTTIE